MFTQNVEHMWNGKKLSECTKEELIKCIDHLYQRYVVSNTHHKTTIPYWTTY